MSDAATLAAVQTSLPSTGSAAPLPTPPSAIAPPPRPPPSQLLGHEQLFNYFGLNRWAKQHLSKPLSLYFDHHLASHGVPVPALSGPLLHDEVGAGSAVPDEDGPNDQLLTYAFQAMPPPLQPRPLSSGARSRVLNMSESCSEGLGESSRLAAILNERRDRLVMEEKHAKREKKRRKREEAAAAAATASTSAASESESASSSNRFTLSLLGGGIIKKRKADGDYLGSESGEDKKKKKKKKDEEIVV